VRNSNTLTFAYKKKKIQTSEKRREVEKKLALSRKDKRISHAKIVKKRIFIAVTGSGAL